MEPDELSANVALLRDWAERAGRDPAAIDVSMKAPLYDASMTQDGPRRRFSGSPEDVLEDIRTYANVGVTHLIFDFRSPNPAETENRMTRFAEEIMSQA